MNTIQGVVCVGSPFSIARARCAIQNNLLVCCNCYNRMVDSDIHPFEGDKVTKRIKCYVCEREVILCYQVSKPILP